MPAKWFRRYSNSLNWSHSLLLKQAHQIAMEMHPLNNLRVLQYLENELAMNEENKSTWYQHWIAEGFRALEKTLKKKFAVKNNFVLENLLVWRMSV